MMNRLLVFFFVCVLCASALPASAQGTVQVRQKTGESKTYKNVKLKMNGENFAVTSADGAGLLVVGKASCTTIGKLVRCLPYDAVLAQYGNAYHIPVKSGTLWVNSSSSKQTVSATSTQLPPNGVLLNMTTKAGTTVSINGTVDEMQK